MFEHIHSFTIYKYVLNMYMNLCFCCEWETEMQPDCCRPNAILFILALLKCTIAVVRFDIKFVCHNSPCWVVLGDVHWAHKLSHSWMKMLLVVASSRLAPAVWFGMFSQAKCCCGTHNRILRILYMALFWTNTDFFLHSLAHSDIERGTNTKPTDDERNLWIRKFTIASLNLTAII